MKADAARLRAYLAALLPDARRALRRLRDTIRAAAPDATEGFAYGIPAFRLDGRPFLYYAAWKNHLGLYPLTAGMRRGHAAALKKYDVAKGTIRFPLSEPLPMALVRQLVRARAAEVRMKRKS